MNTILILILYPICVLGITLIDYKLKFFKRYAFITLKNPTEKDVFRLILRANMVEFFMFFAGLYLGSII